MKTRRFDFNFRPLRITSSFLVGGSVPDRQTYNADTNTYTPDYTHEDVDDKGNVTSDTHLKIPLQVSQMDLDGILSQGPINDKLANVQFFAIENGVETEIQDSDKNYTCVRSGTQAGLIIVKKNVSPTKPLTVRVKAQYADPRTKEVYKINESHLINTTTISERKTVELDTDSVVKYDPLAKGAVSTQIVHAAMRIGSNLTTDSSKVKFVWLKKDAFNDWHKIGSDALTDYDMTVSDDTLSCTVDMSLTGDICYLRCVGVLAGVTVKNDDYSGLPSKDVAFARVIPPFEPDWKSVVDRIPYGYNEAHPIGYAKGIDESVDIEKELLALWYTAKNNASANLSYSLADHGLEPDIELNMDSQYGGMLGFDLKDRKALGAWTDKDGNVIVDSEGTPILIH